MKNYLKTIAAGIVFSVVLSFLVKPEARVGFIGLNCVCISGAMIFTGIATGFSKHENDDPTTWI